MGVSRIERRVNRIGRRHGPGAVRDYLKKRVESRPSAANHELYGHHLLLMANSHTYGSSEASSAAERGNLALLGAREFARAAELGLRHCHLPAARTFESLGYLDAAEAEYGRAIEFTDDADAYRELASLLRRQSLIPDAILVLNDAVDAHPELWAELADLHTLNGDSGSAERSYLSWIATGHSVGNAYLKYGTWLYEHEHDLDAAIVALELAEQALGLYGLRDAVHVDAAERRHYLEQQASRQKLQPLRNAPAEVDELTLSAAELSAIEGARIGAYGTLREVDKLLGPDAITDPADLPWRSDRIQRFNRGLRLQVRIHDERAAAAAHMAGNPEGELAANGQAAAAMERLLEHNARAELRQIVLDHLAAGRPSNAELALANSVSVGNTFALRLYGDFLLEQQGRAGDAAVLFEESATQGHPRDWQRAEEAWHQNGEPQRALICRRNHDLAVVPATGQYERQNFVPKPHIASARPQRDGDVALVTELVPNGHFLKSYLVEQLRTGFALVEPDWGERQVNSDDLRAASLDRVREKCPRVGPAQAQLLRESLASGGFYLGGESAPADPNAAVSHVGPALSHPRKRPADVMRHSTTGALARLRVASVKSQQRLLGQVAPDDRDAALRRGHDETPALEAPGNAASRVLSLPPLNVPKRPGAEAGSPTGRVMRAEGAQDEPARPEPPSREPARQAHTLQVPGQAVDETGLPIQPAPAGGQRVEDGAELEAAPRVDHDRKQIDRPAREVPPPAPPAPPAPPSVPGP